MSVSYFVCYRGRPADAAAFDARYAGTHARILGEMPGLRSLVLHHPVTARDPFPVTPGGVHLVAQMVFDSEAALDAALASEARARARRDFAAFPSFEGSVTHQAMRARVIF